MQKKNTNNIAAKAILILALIIAVLSGLLTASRWSPYYRAQVLQEIVLAAVSEIEPGEYALDGTEKLQITKQGEHIHFALTPLAKDHSRGHSIVITRSVTNGDITQIQVIFRASPLIEARITPNGSASYLHLGIQGRHLQKIPVSAPVELLTLMTPPQIRDLAKHHVDWDTLLAPLPNNTSLRRIVASIQRQLPLLPDAEDGAMNAQGKLVFIEDGTLRTIGGGFNCSGFTKWVADGFYHPLTGKYLTIDSLKTPVSARTSPWGHNYDESRDPYFGLDWSRNIAHQLWHALYRTHGIHPSHSLAIDVQNIPYTTYVKEIGYPVSDLVPILYLLALQEPNRMFVGSVNRQFGDELLLRQHVHLALFIPYFEEDGTFQVIVMERNVEDTLSSFINRNASDFIHLVRLPTLTQFSPPVITDTQISEN